MKDVVADHLEETLNDISNQLARHLSWRYPVGSVVRFYLCPAQRRCGTYSQGLVVGVGARGANALRVVRKAGVDRTQKGGEREIDVLLADIIAVGGSSGELRMKQVVDQAWGTFEAATVKIESGAPYMINMSWEIPR